MNQRFQRRCRWPWLIDPNRRCDDDPIRQSPGRALLIACSDCSLDRRLVTRMVSDSVMVYGSPANCVPCHVSRGDEPPTPFEQLLTSATITDVVVCGHSRCHTVRSSLEASPRLFHGTPGAASHPGDRLGDNIRQGARLLNWVKKQTLVELGHLRTYASIAEGERSGAVTLHAWVYLDETGMILRYRQSDARFVPLDAVDESEDGTTA